MLDFAHRAKPFVDLPGRNSTPHAFSMGHKWSHCRRQPTIESPIDKAFDPK